MATILVVDDEGDSRAVLQLLLGMEGYDVRTASDGAAALEAIESVRTLLSGDGRNRHGPGS